MQILECLSETLFGEIDQGGQRIGRKWRKYKNNTTENFSQHPICTLFFFFIIVITNGVFEYGNINLVKFVFRFGNQAIALKNKVESFF